jgi:hypothetical protein
MTSTMCVSSRGQSDKFCLRTFPTLPDLIFFCKDAQGGQVKGPKEKGPEDISFLGEARNGTKTSLGVLAGIVQGTLVSCHIAICV